MSKLSETELVWEFEGSDLYTIKVTYSDKAERDTQIELALHDGEKRIKYFQFNRADISELREIFGRILATDKL